MGPAVWSRAADAVSFAPSVVRRERALGGSESIGWEAQFGTAPRSVCLLS